MSDFCTIQIFLDQQWIDCAIIELKDKPSKGWLAKTGTYYLFDYAVNHLD